MKDKDTEYEVVHGINGLHMVLEVTDKTGWEFRHPLYGWIPYDRWSDEVTRFDYLVQVQFRRPKTIQPGAEKCLGKQNG